MNMTDAPQLLRPVNHFQPKRKGDWPGSRLLLRADCPRTCGPDGHPSSVGAGSVVSLNRRLNAKDTMHTCRDVSSWGPIRILDVHTSCPTCGAIRQEYIPEAWVDEGKAEFVDQCTPPSLSSAPNREIKGRAFLSGVMYALAEMLSAGGSSVHAVEIARAAGAWEDFRAADCAAYDLRRFARAVGQQGVRSLRAADTITRNMASAAPGLGE